MVCCSFLWRLQLFATTNLPRCCRIRAVHARLDPALETHNREKKFRQQPEGDG